MSCLDPFIEVEPSGTIVMDTKVHILVKNLPAMNPVTLSVDFRHITSQNKELYIGYGQFYSNEDGVADSWDVCVGGGWRGRRSMGLFTTMKPMPHKHRCPRFLVTKNADKILNFRVSAWRGHLTQDEIHQLHVSCGNLGTSKLSYGSRFFTSRYLTSQVIPRTYMHPSVKRVPVHFDHEKGYKIRGVLFIPAGSGPFPAVIDIFGGSGGCVESRAALLASNGFLSFAMAYFNYKDLTFKSMRFPVGMFSAAIDWLMGHQMTDKTCGGVGFSGISFGAQAVLLTALRDSRVKAAVCINNEFLMNTEASSLKDQDGFYDNIADDFFNTGECCASLHGMDFILNGQKTTRPSPHGVATLKRTLPQLTHDNPILFLLGAADTFYNNRNTTGEVHQLLVSSGRKKCWIKMIPGEGHLIEPPYFHLVTQTLDAAKSEDAFFDLIPRSLGGDPELHEKGQELAWETMIEFLRKHLQHQGIHQNKSKL